MKCEDVQLKIIEENVDSNINEHVKECGDCQDFQKSLGFVMKESEEFEVPAELDAKILSYAKANRPSKEEPKPVIPFVLMAVAAVLAILLSVSLLGNKEVTDSGSTEIAGSQEVVNPLEQEKPKEMVAEVETEVESLDSVINNLWGDDSIDADLMAVESELFVLSAELYSN